MQLYGGLLYIYRFNFKDHEQKTILPGGYILHNYRLPRFDRRKLHEELKLLEGNWKCLHPQGIEFDNLKIFEQANGELHIHGWKGDMVSIPQPLQPKMRRGIALEWHENPRNPRSESNKAEFDGDSGIMWKDNWFQKCPEDSEFACF